MSFFKNKKVIVLFIIIVLVCSLYFLNRYIFKNTFKNETMNKKISQEELRKLSSEYFSESFVTDDGNGYEISGGVSNDYYLNVDDLYIRIPFKVAVEIDTRLKDDIDFYFNLVKTLDKINDFNIEKWYKVNNIFFIGRFGIFSYSDFEKILNIFNDFENKTSEIEVIVSNYATGLISLDIKLEKKQKTILLIDVLLSKDSITYYWDTYSARCLY